MFNMFTTRNRSGISAHPCIILYLSYSSLQNGVYLLPQASISTEIYSVYCHMTDIPGCGAGGWTLVMKINGDLVRNNVALTMFIYSTQ